MSQARFLSLSWLQWGLVGIFLIGGGAVVTNMWKSNTCKGSCSASCKKAAQNANVATDTANLASIEHTGNSPEFPANVQANSEQTGREIAATNPQTSTEITSPPVVQEASLNPLTASQAKKTNVKDAKMAAVSAKAEVKPNAIPVVSNKREIAPVSSATAIKGADYHLIAASADSWKKAGVFKENFKKQGFDAYILHNPSDKEFYRVAIFKNADKKKVEEIKAKTKLPDMWITQ